jgi:hypothetical protein
MRTGDVEDASDNKPSLHNRIKLGLTAETNFAAVEYSFIPATKTESSLRTITFRFRF